jgi:NAD(P)H-hydrate epimerase
MLQIDKNIVKKAIIERSDDANKGSCGSLLSVCGCYGMAGAAIMAGKASLKCGLGLLKMALPKSIYPIAASNILESVYFSLEETAQGKISKSNIPFLLKQAEISKTVLVGCGISVCDDTKAVVYEIIRNCSKPILLDADALNCVSKNIDILKSAKAPVIITPHSGEMARLTGLSIKEVNSNREKTAVEFAEKYGVICVLKGAGTVIASPDGQTFINPTGNSGMATGGSGDVLAGMISSLLAQGAEPLYSAVGGVYLHGLAGDIAAEKYGKISMLPTDLIECIYLAFENVLNS